MGKKYNSMPQGNYVPAQVCKPVTFPINESLNQTQTLYLADMDCVCLSPKADQTVYSFDMAHVRYPAKADHT